MRDAFQAQSAPLKTSAWPVMDRVFRMTSRARAKRAPQDSKPTLIGPRASGALQAKSALLKTIARSARLAKLRTKRNQHVKHAPQV